MERDIIYDHYKDSNEHQKSYIAKRDRLTIWLLLTIVSFYFLLSNPESLTNCVNQYIKGNFQIDSVVLDFSMLHTGAIFLLLWIVLQYYQTCLTIEKQYEYLWKLESYLSEEGVVIKREGDNYATNYPLLKNVANFLYAWGIPIGVGALAMVRGWNVCFSQEGNVWIDVIGFSIIFILSVLYFF